MSNQSFMDKFRAFLGLDKGPPTNSFRNPLWGTDEDNYDDGLYDTRRNEVELYDPSNFHREMTEASKQMEEVFKLYSGIGNIFRHFKDFVPNSHVYTFNEEDEGNRNIFDGNIRDYFFNPDIFSHNEIKRDQDLDGMVSSNDISSFLKRHNSESEDKTMIPFRDNFGPGKSFFKTVITTSVTKPDGTVETRRIVKDQNGVVEETTTQSLPTPKNYSNTNMDNMLIANQVFSNFAPGFILENVLLNLL